MSVRYKSSSELIPTKSNKTFLAFTLLGLETDHKTLLCQLRALSVFDHISRQGNIEKLKLLFALLYRTFAIRDLIPQKSCWLDRAQQQVVDSTEKFFTALL